MIIFTASVQQYGDPVIDMLDPHGYVKERLFRPVILSFFSLFFLFFKILKEYQSTKLL